jgi:hypothetical protein
MKRVKHLILLSVFAFFSLASAHADGHEELITFDRLPKAAQEFLTTHFKDLTLAYIVADHKIMTVEYEVTYTERTEVDFRADGSWESVERKYAPVPAAIVPKQIADFVARNQLFAGQFIREIERNPYTWEIKLSGGLEVKFDAQFNVIGYDD